MYQLANKRIVLGVTGGIAAYKSALLIRLLRQYGADVRVVMTQNASQFITPLTLQALSGHAVHLELLDAETESAMGHIDLARWADLVLVAPASANFIARYANGLAGDLLNTLCLAADSPVMVAPAMNQQMWLNPATQANVSILDARGIQILGPALGDQACGETGPGRMLEPEELLERLAQSFSSDILSGSRLMITAGPTQEAVDPVRFISNRSSGQMGYAIAAAAIEAGADVSVISGPVNIDPPERADLTHVVSASEMHRAVMQSIKDVDIFISTAAVADYRLSSVAPQKIKKQADEIQLSLIKNPDILAEVALLENAPFTVGFAAETQDLEINAKNKLQRKKLDMVAANNVGEGLGFNVNTNALTVIWNEGKQELATAPKEKLARHLIRLVADQYHAKNTNQMH